MELFREAKSAHMERVAAMTVDDDMRPFTVSTVGELTASPRSMLKSMRKGSPKKPWSREKKVESVETTSTLLDGWGDFDTDRLLWGGVGALSNDMAPERNGFRSVDGEGVRSVDRDDEEVTPVPSPARRWSLKEQQRKYDALARRGSPPTPSREPLKQQVLRQRTMAMMALEAPEGPVRDQASAPSPNGSPSGLSPKKSLVSYRKKLAIKPNEGALCLPQVTHGSRRGATREEHRQPGLFGREVLDSNATRRAVFTHFLPLWTVMESSDNSYSSSCSESEDQDRLSTQDRGKSPLECGMALMKICKTIGILLSVSPPPDVWLSSLPSKRARKRRKQRVDFDSFCEFVVRNALQPAFHHFKLDRDMNEYVHTVDCVVQSLLIEQTAQVGSGLGWCLRELGEIQPVLPQWKTGIQVVQKQLPLGQSVSASAYQPAEMLRSEDVPPSADANAIRGSLGSSSSAKTLPATESRALQEANIQRKMQLRQSWQPWLVAYTQQESQHQSDLSVKAGRSDADDVGALGSCMRVEGVQPPNNVYVSSDNNRGIAHSRDDHKDDIPTQERHNDDELTLICGACTSEREATLWCSSCFAVFCADCWTTTHQTVVDSTIVDNQRELPAPTARPALLSHRGETPGFHSSPPVEIVYLPTKPLGVGKLQRGFKSHNQHVNQHDNDRGDVQSDSIDLGSSLQLPQVSSHPILPSIKPLKQRAQLKRTPQSHSTPVLETTPSPLLDSTANLLKALMLGTASSASVMGSSPASSSTPSVDNPSAKTVTKRMFKDPVSRKKLHPASVTLDANALLPG